MAKKKGSLSPEEILQNALVPDWEQPYQVPENWMWVKFGSLTHDMADGPFGSNLKSEHYTEEKEARIIQLSNIGEDGWREENTKYTTFNHAYTIAKSIVSSGDIVIAKMMPAGRAIIVPNNEQMYVLSSDAIKMVPTRVVSTQFLVRGINCTFFRNQVQENTQGIIRARTSISKLKEYAFPLPPVAEQQRIVNRIESLLSKLDEAKEKAQTALDSYEKHKAVILHKAFTGELTKKWREENCVSLDSWEKRKLGKCGEWFGGGTPTTSIAEYWDDGTVLWVTPKDMKSNIIVDTIDHITEAAIESSSAKLIADNAILFVVRSGILRRILPIAMTKCPVTVNQDIKALVPQNVSQEYIFWACIANEKSIRDSCSKSGTTVESISTGLLHEYMLPIPTPEEQSEIVRILESIIEKEQKAKEHSNVIEKIDLMKKVILARAFRGELATNNPEEESAKELLKSILLDKINTVPSIEKKKSVLVLEDSKMPKTILEALSEHKSLTPEKLKAQTGIKDIDDFYAELKKLVDTGAVIERREGEENYLEVNNEGRQA
ncbi:restriction endonuclease subunit S [Paenibacillus sp. M-152]|uniref:restriction endonuclease subunit S n=1 Tax=Paenibacillus sp. M-152 TaxID=2487928 RepID=UPI0013EA625A|nr:restriction endonuclease subunit S [Paenibacillus sp. M-152]